MTWKVKVALLSIGFLASFVALGFWLEWDFSRIDRETVRAGVEHLSQMGAWSFFGCLAVLPLFGVPVSIFLLVASTAFGTAGALVGSVLAMACNVFLGWLIAGKLFRPQFEKLMHWAGYSIPNLSRRRMVDVAILLRVTPGFPFCIQNYLLGLSGMPLLLYLAVSIPLNALVTITIVLMGEAVLSGNGALIMASVGLLTVAAVLFRMLRERTKAKARKLEIDEL